MAADDFWIRDAETLKALSDPLRVAVIRALDSPRTAKEVARIVDRDVTTLYYHLRLLEKHGLITVVETRKTSAIPESVYQAAARRYHLADQLISAGAGDEVEILLGALFDGTKREVRHSIRQGAIRVNEDGVLAHYQARLTPAQFKRFTARLQRLAHDLQAAGAANPDDERTLPVGLTLALYPYTGTDDSDT
jgi:DNA-binding transcriptional ArsR family regulator